MSRDHVVIGCVLASALAACAPRGVRPGAPRPAEADAAWVERSLGSLSLEQKAGQVLMPVMLGYLAHPESDAARQLDALVTDVGVGGFIVRRGDPLELAATLNRLQSLAPLPLLIAADFERGAGVQVPHGATFLPHAMAIAATGSEADAEAAGRATAREARALGVHMTFAPVVDVNNNPDNPIVNIRSFGEEPETAARLSAAFVRGAHAGGLLTTAKHFPGHGDTAVDSHSALAVIEGDRDRIERVELTPFRAAIAAGVDAVMVGHLAVPALDASGLPATVSRPIVTDLLRGELGFQGLIVSDALDMRGITDSYGPGEAAVRTLLAGQDVVLMSPEPEQAKAAIVAAVREGRLPQTRLDDAVRHLLRAKRAAGLQRERQVALDRIWTSLGDPALIAQMQAVADRSITLVKDDGGVLPLGTPRLLHVTLSGDPVEEPLRELPEEEVGRRCPTASFALVDPRTGREQLQEVLAQAREADAVLVSAFVRVQARKGTAALPEDLAGFLGDLVALGRPLAVISFASPYLLRQFPQVPAYLCAYSWSPLSQRAAYRAVFGEIPISGRLPVSLPGLYERGHGLVRPAAAAGRSSPGPSRAPRAPAR